MPDTRRFANGHLPDGNLRATPYSPTPNPNYNGRFDFLHCYPTYAFSFDLHYWWHGL